MSPPSLYLSLSVIFVLLHFHTQFEISFSRYIKTLGNFIRISLNTQLIWGRTDNFIILCFPMNISLHLVKFSFPPRLFLFSSEKSCPFFWLYLLLGPKNFYSVVNSTYLNFSFSVCCWHIDATYFYWMLSSNFAELINSNNLSVNSLNFPFTWYFIHTLWYFHFFLSNLLTLVFFFLGFLHLDLFRAYSTRVNRGRNNLHPCFVPDLKGKAVNISSLIWYLP